MVSFVAVKRPRLVTVVLGAGSVAEIMPGWARRPVPSSAEAQMVTSVAASFARAIKASIDPAWHLREACRRYVAGEIDVSELERQVADAVARGA